MDEKMRAEFEAWWREEYDSTLYCENAWRGWKASRAALVVELPEKISQYNTDECGIIDPSAAEHDEAIDDCRAAIEAAGVRVKT